jgi:hypothetical protein
MASGAAQVFTNTRNSSLYNQSSLNAGEKANMTLGYPRGESQSLWRNTVTSTNIVTPCRKGDGRAETARVRRGQQRI